jgi:hypothetical protein
VLLVCHFHCYFIILFSCTYCTWGTRTSWLEPKSCRFGMERTCLWWWVTHNRIHNWEERQVQVKEYYYTSLCIIVAWCYSGSLFESELKHSLSPVHKHCIDCCVSYSVGCSHIESAFLYIELYIPVFQEGLKIFPIGLVMYSTPSKQIVAHILLLFCGYTEHFKLYFFCVFFSV